MITIEDERISECCQASIVVIYKYPEDNWSADDYLEVCSQCGEEFPNG